MVPSTPQGENTDDILELMRTNFVEFIASFGTFEDIPGLSRYDVSDKGYVKNKHTHKLLVPKVTKDGHEHVMLMDDFGKRKWFPVRFLVAKTFVYNEHNLNEVDHINGDRCNNEANNLIWI